MDGTTRDLRRSCQATSVAQGIAPAGAETSFDPSFEAFYVSHLVVGRPRLPAAKDAPDPFESQRAHCRHHNHKHRSSNAAPRQAMPRPPPPPLPPQPAASRPAHMSATPNTVAASSCAAKARATPPNSPSAFPASAKKS